MSKPVVVSQTEIFHNLQVAAALALEINTNRRFNNGSVMRLAANMCGSKHHTKVAVLRDYVAWLTKWFEERSPDPVKKYEPNPSVRRAMEK